MKNKRNEKQKELKKMIEIFVSPRNLEIGKLDMDSFANF